MNQSLLLSTLNDGNQSGQIITNWFRDDLILGANIATVHTYCVKKVISEKVRGTRRRSRLEHGVREQISTDPNYTSE